MEDKNIVGQRKGQNTDQGKKYGWTKQRANYQFPYIKQKNTVSILLMVKTNWII